MKILKWLLAKHSERLCLRQGFVRCHHCRCLTRRKDRYCWYCGRPNKKKKAEVTKK